MIGHIDLGKRLAEFNSLHFARENSKAPASRQEYRGYQAPIANGTSRRQNIHR